MSEKSSEKSEMSSVEFVHDALRDHIAPRSIGSGKERKDFAYRALKKHERATAERKRKRVWTENRVKDFWHADVRVEPNADELRDIEEMTGLRYGREELRSNEQIIAYADALLDGQEEGVHSAFAAAVRAVARVANRSRAER